MQFQKTILPVMKNRQTLWIVLVVILLCCIGGGIYYILLQRKEMSQLELQFNYDKELLEDEYNQLSLEYRGYQNELSLQSDGYQLTIRNDSLLFKLEQEQAKVQRLMEEIRTVKITNATKINDMRKELETLRTILKGYVQEIDSLNRINQILRDENIAVTKKYEQANKAVSNLSRENEQLSERVSLASKLDAGHFKITGITSNRKATTKINKMDQIEINFTINKNISAPTGEKTIYVRIQRPNGEVLVKDPNQVFQFENKEINYSSKRVIEYTGDEYPVSIYWKKEEFLSAGSYRVDVFADGNLIGKQDFKLED